MADTTTRDRILELLGKYSYRSAGQVASDLGLDSEKSVQKLLNQMVKEGLITKSRPSGWPVIYKLAD